MSKEKHIIYVRGLHDQSLVSRRFSQILPEIWLKKGFQTHVVEPHWEEGKSFAPKQKLITDEIDLLLEKGYDVFLYGNSAGGSGIMNAGVERQNEIKGMANVTGRLRRGENVRPSLKTAARSSPAFAESVILFENVNEPKLLEDNRKKVITVRPVWDEIVPASTVSVRGATNIVVPVPEHTVGGMLIATVFVNKIFDFFKQL